MSLDEGLEMEHRGEISINKSLDAMLKASVSIYHITV